jgi:glycosyltransferase involved in cell wall biosynthesis
VEALVAAGHSVTTACYFEHTPNMVERFRLAGADVRLLSSNGDRPIGMKAVSKHLWQGLRSVIRDVRPDVAHVQYMAPGLLPILFLRAMGVRKILATTHTDADIYSHRGLKLIHWITKHVLTGFQCITLRAENSYFGSASLFDGRLMSHFTIYNAIPSHIKLAQQSRARIADDGIITIGVVSRLEKIKGMDLVIPAFAKVCDESLNLRLLVVGDGTERNHMERQVTEYGISNRVNFVGVKPQNELMDYYDRIDILLMPSRSEGFGLTAIEGMARGCVPVVANTGGLPEVVTPKSGLIHNYEDIDDMASKIQLLISNRTMLAKLSAGAITRAKDFSQNKYQFAIAKLYKAI